MSFWASRTNALLAAPEPEDTPSRAFISDSVIVVAPTLILVVPVIVLAIKSVTVKVANPDRFLFKLGISTLLATAVPSVIPDNWSNSGPVTLKPANLLISVAPALMGTLSNFNVLAFISPVGP